MKFTLKKEKHDPKWVKDFLKQGAFAFTKESFELLDAVRKKYSGEWIAYLGVVRDSLKGPRGVRLRPQFAEIDRRISALQDRMRNVATYIGRIINYLEAPTEQEVKDLFGEIKAIEQEYADLIRAGEENKEFQQVLENLRIQAGLDLRSLATAHRLVEGRLRALKTEKPEGFLKTAIWESPTFAQFRQMAWGLAGPIGIAARVAVGKYREWREQRREAKKRKRWEEEAPEIGRIAPYLPEEVLEAYLRERAPVRVRGMPGGERIRTGEGVRRGAREREPEVTVGGAKIRMEDLPPDVQEFLREQMAGMKREERAERARERGARVETPRFGREGRFETAGVGRGRVETGGVGAALYQFFDKDAYKARWTTEVMGALRRAGAGVGRGIGGVFQGIMGWLRNLFSMIITFIKSVILRGMPGGERIRRGEEVVKGKERIREREPKITVGGAEVRMEELPPDVQDFLREQMAGVRAERARERGERRERVEGTTRVGGIETGRGRVETGGIRASLYQFFDKDAYRARWTTEIMEALKDIKRGGGRAGGGGGIGGVLQGMLGWLKGLVPMIVPIVLVALSALAGWFIGRFIGQALGRWMQQGRERQELLGRAEEIRRTGGRTEVARALELQAKGMSIRESVIQAKRELGQPISEAYLKPSEKKVEPVPMPEGSLVGEVREGNEKIARGISKLAELYEKKASVSIPEGKERTSDTRNIGDPYLETLDRGAI